MLVLTAFVSTLFLQELLLAFVQESERYSLAILNLSVEGGDITRTEARVLTARLTSEFTTASLFFTMNQTDMERGLLTNDLDTDGCATMDCAIRAGRALGVQLVVFGIVDENEPMFSIKLRMVHLASEQVVKTLEEVYAGDLAAFMERMPLFARNLMGAAAAQSPSSPSRPEPAPIEEEYTATDSGGGFKWYYLGLGLLIAGGVGAGVVLARKDSAGDPVMTAPILPTFSDLPGPPTFP